MATYSNNGGYADWRDWEFKLDKERNMTTGFTPRSTPTSAFVSGALDGDYTGKQSYLSGIGLGGDGGKPTGKGNSVLSWDWWTKADKDNPMAPTTSWDTNLGRLGNITNLAGGLYSMYNNIWGDGAKATKLAIEGAKFDLAEAQKAAGRKDAWHSAMAANANNV